MPSSVARHVLLFTMFIVTDVTVGPESMRMNGKVSGLSSFQRIDRKFGKRGDVVGGLQRVRIIETSTGRRRSLTRKCLMRHARL